MWLRGDLISIVVLSFVALFSSSAVGAEALPVATASYVNIPRERILDGLIEAVHQATVSAQTSGRIIRINYDVDDFVEKGAVLLQFRDREQRARYDGALANFQQAESEFRRTDDLSKKGLASPAELDKAQAQLKATRAQLDQAKENLEHTRVRAPYSGIVVKRHIEIGETARVGQKLFTGISLEQLRAAVNVPEDIINRVRANKQARVLINRTDSRSVPAESLTITPYADPDSHTFLVRVNLAHGDFGIYPGMFAKVAFVLDEQPQLVIPFAAVAVRSEVRAVYVLDSEQHLQFRQVRLGRRLDDGGVVILAGLSEGESVALDPVQAAMRFKDEQSENKE